MRFSFVKFSGLLSLPFFVIWAGRQLLDGDGVGQGVWIMAAPRLGCKCIMVGSRLLDF